MRIQPSRSDVARLPGVAPVTLHLVRAAHEDLAVVAGGELAPGLVPYADLHPRVRTPGRGEQAVRAAGDVARGEHRDVADLGLPVPLVDHGAQPVHRLGQSVRAERRAGHHQRAQAAHVGRLLAEQVEHLAQPGHGDDGPGDPVAFDGVREERPPIVLGDHRGAAAEQAGAEELHHHDAGQRAEQHVAPEGGGELGGDRRPDAGLPGPVRRERPVGDRAPLGIPGAPTGKGHKSHIIRLSRDHRLRSAVLGGRRHQVGGIWAGAQGQQWRASSGR